MCIRDSSSTCEQAPVDADLCHLVSYKEFIFFSCGKVINKHFIVGKEGRIFKIFGARRTLPHAGLAFDAHTGYGHTVCLDGAHGTSTCADPAFAAFFHIRQRFCFQELGRLTVPSQGRIVRAHRAVAGHLYNGLCGSRRDPLCRLLGKRTDEMCRRDRSSPYPAPGPPE